MRGLRTARDDLAAMAEREKAIKANMEAWSAKTREVDALVKMMKQVKEQLVTSGRVPNMPTATKAGLGLQAESGTINRALPNFPPRKTGENPPQFPP